MQGSLIACSIALLLLASLFMTSSVHAPQLLNTVPALPAEVCNAVPVPDPNATGLGLNPGELTIREGPHPIYVVVLADEEERATTRFLGQRFDWQTYALQIERADDVLTQYFGIDIRILAMLPWTTNNATTTMADLWWQLEGDTRSILHAPYQGSQPVDAIIGITNQQTDPVMGVAPGSELLAQGKTIVLVKWQVYWADDNLCRYLLSQLYGLSGHIEPLNLCCCLALHTHFQSFWIEDGFIWSVFSDIYCCLTSTSYCYLCSAPMYYHRMDFQPGDLPVLLNWTALGTGYDYDSWWQTIYWWKNELNNATWQELKQVPITGRQR